jgi:hypothetical protein
MEEKIKDLFDNFDIDDTEKIMESDVILTLDKQTVNRIKSSVFQKSGLKKKPLFSAPQKLAACFAALALSLSIIGFDHIGATLSRIFSFVPGYEIIEGSDSIKYVVDTLSSTENDEVVFALTNAFATRDNTIVVMFEISRKYDMDAAELLIKLEDRTMPKINLYAGSTLYKKPLGGFGGSEKSTYAILAYEVKSQDINDFTLYRLENEDYNLSLEFRLKEFEPFSSLEEIGATGYNNDISITAVPHFTDNKVEVDLYTINKSGYNLYSFFKEYDNGYLNKDLHLETSRGTIKYSTPGSYMGANRKFFFDIAPDDKNMTLKIPFIIVESSNEYKDITLPIPKKEGEKIVVNKRLDFKDCTMIIVDVEKRMEEGEHGELRITVAYENKAANRIMMGAEYYRLTFWGNITSGGYYLKPDENDITRTINFYLNKGEKGNIKMRVSKPRYYFTDEYSLRLQE